jgi:hypothetical protein
MALFSITKESLDKTVKIFDQFYDNTLVIPSDQYDIVNSYFIGVCSTKEIANNYTAIIFRIAQESGTSALTLLENVKGTAKNKVDINKIFAYYLNSFKSKTSLYGIAQIPRPSLPVARNVVL